MFIGAGINVVDEEGNYRDLEEVFDDLILAWDKMTEEQINIFMEEFEELLFKD